MKAKWGVNCFDSRRLAGGSKWSELWVCERTATCPGCVFLLGQTSRWAVLLGGVWKNVVWNGVFIFVRALTEACVCCMAHMLVRKWGAVLRLCGSPSQLLDSWFDSDFSPNAFLSWLFLTASALLFFSSFPSPPSATLSLPLAFPLAGQWLTLTNYAAAVALCVTPLSHLQPAVVLSSNYCESPACSPLLHF